ncbi:FG-GAP repeat domain-containing protein [Celeribacter sp.]|uniref:FG-GAP repeat domain-containing protein n=1 Tax=Celeribacter sp. TaxID=1890673 RepID=UPI003A91BA8E
MKALVAALAIVAAPVLAQTTQPVITSARYVEPTDSYGHGAVANGEYAALEVMFSDGEHRTIRWGNAVFEDTTPRLHDFDGDGAPEVVTVLSDTKGGAHIQLIKAVDGLLSAAGGSVPIGRRNRWLAVAGIADFDGDGLDEIAYIDRPHLAKELVLLSVDMSAPKTRLTEVARTRGLTNHHYGSAVIEGGVRTCAGEAAVVLTANGDWSQIMETRVVHGELISIPVAPYDGPESFVPYMRCP